MGKLFYLVFNLVVLLGAAVGLGYALFGVYDQEFLVRYTCIMVTGLFVRMVADDMKKELDS